MWLNPPSFLANKGAPVDVVLAKENSKGARVPPPPHGESVLEKEGSKASTRAAPPPPYAPVAVELKQEVESELALCLIGATRVGKSSLGNVLGDLKEDTKFVTSASINSCTFETTVKKCVWFDDGAPFLLIDTPGLGDSDGRDSTHIAKMAEVLKRQRFVRLFMLVFNGEDARLNEHMRGLILVFTEMFGSEFFQNVCLVFTHWPCDPKSKNRRLRGGLTEEKRREEFNQLFSQKLGYNGPPVPAFFLDNLYDAGDPEEVALYQSVFKNIKKLALSLKPFECQSVVTVLSLKDRAIQRAKDLENALEHSEKTALEAAESAELRRLGDLAKANKKSQEKLKEAQIEAESKLKEETAKQDQQKKKALAEQAEKLKADTDAKLKELEREQEQRRQRALAEAEARRKKEAEEAEIRRRAEVAAAEERRKKEVEAAEVLRRAEIAAAQIREEALRQQAAAEAARRREAEQQLASS